MKRLSSRAITLLTNGFLALIVLAIGAICFLPAVSVASGVNDGVYAKGNSKKGVSLMFNVYWGTDTVLQIVDLLNEFGVKATFFLGGCWADDNVECVKKIADSGHEIASHGYFHREHDKLSFEENVSEIQASIEFLSRITGREITLFAPPSGAYSKDTVRAAQSLGLRTVLWSKDTVDWRDKDDSLVYTRATEGAAGGDLILMHPMPHTLRALPRILMAYANAGLSILPVGENLTSESN